MLSSQTPPRGSHGFRSYAVPATISFLGVRRGCPRWRCHLACLHPPPSAGGRCDFLHTTVPLEEGPKFPQRPGAGAEPSRRPPPAAPARPRQARARARRARPLPPSPGGLAGPRPGPQSSVPPPVSNPFSKQTHFLTKWKADLRRQQVSPGCALAPPPRPGCPRPGASAPHSGHPAPRSGPP